MTNSINLTTHSSQRPGLNMNHSFSPRPVERATVAAGLRLSPEAADYLGRIVAACETSVLSHPRAALPDLAMGLPVALRYASLLRSHVMLRNAPAGARVELQLCGHALRATFDGAGVTTVRLADTGDLVARSEPGGGCRMAADIAKAINMDVLFTRLQGFEQASRPMALPSDVDAWLAAQQRARDACELRNAELLEALSVTPAERCHGLSRARC